MKTYNFKKKIPKNRKIELELPKDAPTGKVDLIVVVEPEEKKPKGMTGKDMVQK